MTTAALAVALTVLAGLTALQVLLIAGRPVGEYAWGGRHRVPTPRLRKAAAAAIALYAAFALLLASRAGVLPGGGTGTVVVATWVLFGYFAVSTVPNAISRSRRERLAQTPVSIVLALSTLAIAVA